MNFDLLKQKLMQLYSQGQQGLQQATRQPSMDWSRMTQQLPNLMAQQRQQPVQTGPAIPGLAQAQSSLAPYYQKLLALFGGR